MASSDASVYFPSLDKCLDGTAQLLSWQQVYVNLRDGVGSEENGAVHRFFADSKAREILTKIQETFSQPNAQSRSSFDRLTSAINAPSSANGKYNIEQLKSDSLWLSKTTGIDEVSALRLATLELQRRPEDQIVDEVKSTEETGFGRSLRQPALLRSILGASQATDLNRSVFRVESTDTKARQLRLLALLLLERVYASKIRQLATFAFTAEEDFGGPRWLRELGSAMTSVWIGATGDFHSFSAEILAAFDTGLGSIKNGCSWVLDEEQLEQIWVLWLDSAATEFALNIQLLLHLVQHRSTLLPSNLVMGWFELMDKTFFFESFDTINPDLNETQVNAIQSLVSLLSVAVLQPSTAVSAIDDFAAEATAPSQSNAQSYLRETKCVETITNVLLNATGGNGSKRLVLAGPSMFAWVIIMQTVRSYATASIDARETRQAQKVLEQQPHDSDSDSIDLQFRSRSGERRRSSFGSDSEPPATLIEMIADVVQRVLPNDDPIHLFAECAVGLSSGLRAFETIARISIDFCTPYGHDCDGQVGLQMRTLFLQLLSSSLIWMPYSPEILEAVLAVLAGGSTNAELQLQCNKFPHSHPIARFIGDERFKAQIFDQALLRFPYESAPLFALAQCLAHVLTDKPDQSISMIIQALHHRSSLTTFLIEGLADWDLADADEVRLQSPIDVFTAFDWQANYEDGASHHALLEWYHGRPQTNTPFIIPTGATGRVLKSGSANEGKVVMWNYPHSALSFIGFKLQRDAKTWVNDGSVPAEFLNDPVVLINSLLQAATHEQAIQVLGECSDNLYDDVDIIQVIMDLCEALMYRPQAVDGVSALLVSCVSFIRTVLRILPGRVWPYIGRSGLLGLNKSESRLHVIIATSEVPSALFPFLTEVVGLFDALVKDALARSVERKASTKALTRFETTQANVLSVGVTEGRMAHIISQFHALMTDIYESCRNWRFALLGQRTNILASLSTVMATSLHYAYEIDDSDENFKKLFGFMEPSAAYVADVFLASSQNNSACNALVESILDGIEDVSMPLAREEKQHIIKQTSSALNLARRLVLLRHARDQMPAALEESLFRAVPQLIKIYNMSPLYKTPIIELLEALVLTAGRQESPPSFLAYVATDTARNFLKVLFKLDAPCKEERLATRIWNFLTAVVTQRQQWFSIFILTGSTPRETLKNSKSKAEDSRHDFSMLGLALEKISRLPNVGVQEAEALLEFVAQAADFWPRVCTQIRQNKDAMNSLLRFLNDFDTSESVQRAASADIPFKIQIAAHILNIVALLVNSDGEKGDKSFASGLMSNLEQFVQGSDLQHSAVSNPNYNTSLHERLSRNFSVRYANCDLINLKRTLVSKATLGRSFFYDTIAAETVLSYDGAWSGSKGSGFKGEMILANENMSLVETSIKLFYSWKSLIIELANVVEFNPSFTSNLAKIVINSLKANQDSHLPAEIFQRLAQARADLAFTLLQHLVPHLGLGKQAEQILVAAWEVVKEAADDLGGALVGDEGAYHRTCLKTLSLALRPHRQEASLEARRSVYSTSNNKSLAIEATLLEILRVVVAGGFKSLVSVLHDDASKVQASDVALLLAILRIVLTIPGMVKHHSDMLSIFSDEKTATYASTLFSWSDRILVDGDPIYGEISMNFLLELSSIRPIAEAMVANGCLGQILASSLTRVYQQGLGPFDPPVRVYNVWARGILPLAINILSALGPLIAADIAAFVNRFTGQLAQVNTRFSAKETKGPYSGLITLAMAGEIHSLALLVQLLDFCKEAGASAGIVSSDIQDLAFDKTRVAQDIEDLLSRRSGLKEVIVPRDSKEELWSRSKPSEGASGGSTNKLEERIIDLLSSALDILNSNEN